MGFKNSSLLTLALLLACSSAIYAFDITQMLGKNPEFSTFNKYLTETKLAEQINSRNTITVLAVNNAGLSSIAGKSPEVIKSIISTHVILDYFDEKKLMDAIGSGQQLTTLFQSSGLAKNKQGFLKVSLIGEGSMAFSSAESGAQADASELMNTFTSEPYNISILQVTKPIIAPGIDSVSSGAQGAKAPTAAQGAKAPITTESAKAPAAVDAKASIATKSAKAPAAAQDAKAPAATESAKAPVLAQSAKAPVPTQSAKAPTSSATAESPMEAAEAPTSGAAAPTTLADSPLADGPTADEGAAADATSPTSSSSTTKMGLIGAVMTFASLLVVL